MFTYSRTHAHTNTGFSCYVCIIFYFFSFLRRSPHIWRSSGTTKLRLSYVRARAASKICVWKEFVFYPFEKEKKKQSKTNLIYVIYDMDQRSKFECAVIYVYRSDILERPSIHWRYGTGSNSLFTCSQLPHTVLCGNAVASEAPTSICLAVTCPAFWVDKFNWMTFERAVARMIHHILSMSCENQLLSSYFEYMEYAQIAEW